MGFIQLTSVTFSPTPTTNQIVTVKYKLASDPDVPASYTTVTTTALVLTNGDFSPPVNIPSLLDDTEYTVFVTPNCGGGGAMKNFVTGVLEVPNLYWIPLATECETSGGFEAVSTITDLSSPKSIWYDVVNELVYVADYDDALGNVYWFDPLTATVPGDMIHSLTVNSSEMYANAIDPLYRKIYFVGRYSGGLIVYDIDTDTTSTVAFGADGIAFNRTTLFVSTNYIYSNIGNSSGSTHVVIIDRVTLAIVSITPVGSLPGSAHFSGGGFSLIEANSKIYVYSRNNSSATVGVYNQLLTSLLLNLTLPSVATWDFGKYWHTGIYDPISNQLYFGDIGSARRYVVDADTDTVIDNRVATNREGKTDAQHDWFINPIDGNLYTAFSALNSSVDSSPIRRMYKEDRATFQYLDMFEGDYITEGVEWTGAGQIIGTAPGLVFWSGNPIYDTDGVITFFSSFGGAENTGIELTLTLQEIDGNNFDIPTGNTKPNTIEDPDYIPPTENLTACPITPSLACPTDGMSTFSAGTLVYEFAIITGVRYNPSIDNIAVYAYDTNLLARDGAPIVISDPTLSSYYSGSFAGLGGVSYKFEVVYRDAALVELATCISDTTTTSTTTTTTMP